MIGKAGKAHKINKSELDKVRELVRNAQWFWDYIAAENSMGFHNPDQALNTLGLGTFIDPQIDGGKLNERTFKEGRDIVELIRQWSGISALQGISHQCRHYQGDNGEH